MQKAIITGRLGRDAAIRETQNGTKVISFTVAVNSRVRNVEKTSWYDVSAFNYERYKNMVNYLTKGSGVRVIGDLDADLETGSDGVTRCRRNIIADSIEFDGSGTSSGSTESNTTKAASEKQAPAEPEEEDMPRTKTSKKVKTEPEPAPKDNEDDLPF